MVILSLIPVQHFSFVLLSDEGPVAVAEVGGANLQDDLGANPPSFAEVSRELQLAICEFYFLLIRMVLFCNQALRSKKGIDIPKRTVKPSQTGTARVN